MGAGSFNVTSLVAVSIVSRGIRSGGGVGLSKEQIEKIDQEVNKEFGILLAAMFGLPMIIMSFLCLSLWVGPLQKTVYQDLGHIGAVSYEHHYKYGDKWHAVVAGYTIDFCSEVRTGEEIKRYVKRYPLRQEIGYVVAGREIHTGTRIWPLLEK